MKKLMLLLAGVFALLHDVRADANYWQDGVPWEIWEDPYGGYAGINTIGDKSVSGDIVVPNEYYGYDVTSISWRPFAVACLLSGVVGVFRNRTCEMQPR